MRAVGSAGWGAARAASDQPSELINDERRGKTTPGGRNRTVSCEPLAVEYFICGRKLSGEALGRRRGAGAAQVGDAGTNVAPPESSERG